VPDKISHWFKGLVVSFGKKRVVSAARVSRPLLSARARDVGVRVEEQQRKKSSKGAQLEPGGYGEEKGRGEH
jgi:hypothetical protein